MAGRPFVTSEVLTGIAIGFHNPDYTLIADSVLPRVPVGGDTFKWLEYPIDEALTVPETRVGRKGRVNIAEFNATERGGATKDYGLGVPIPQTDIDQAAARRKAGLSTFDPELHAAAYLTNLVLLDREVRVAKVAQDPNNFVAGQVQTLTGTAQFSDFTNSDPIGVISDAIDSGLVRFNRCTMGFAAWKVIRRHPKIVNAVKGNVTGQGIITREQFRDLFELKEFNVGESWVNTARKGQPANRTRVWGKNISLTFIDRQATPETGGLTWGFSPQYGTRIAGTVIDSDVGLKGGREIRVGEQIDELIVAKAAGALIQAVVA